MTPNDWYEVMKIGLLAIICFLLVHMSETLDAYLNGKAPDDD